MVATARCSRATRSGCGEGPTSAPTARISMGRPALRSSCGHTRVSASSSTAMMARATTASARRHGPGLYLKNAVGPVVARDNVLFNQFGYGIHIYTDGGAGLLNNISAIGNISFDNGSLASTGPSAEIGNLGQPPANNLVITNSMTYVAPSVGGSNLVLGSGDGLTATGNYVIGGNGISQGSWTNATIANNTVIPSNATQTVVSIRPNAYEPGRAFVAVYNGAGL